ncbi:hypothetical protein [Pelagicoccus sp. SDUM812003]|uniref:hypothetical protein n=1 Tax=Pelagicoccus sp. SDUM812003 TaxID=3041267 RepID=UPI00280EB7F2|nr:hypothetical protein [Pelagicoccus sp. SDUM812003]MDQ8205583.1 hypothetical protein [Pelagicoccus sp. SDUM812003]
MKRRLSPEHRAEMRELLGGFVQHCEISKHLAGSIDLFVEHNGHKYGLPVFSFFGPPHRDLDSRFVGLLARNQGSDKRTSEALLQFLERLVLQPNLATGLVLSALPVTDPIALESGNDFHPDELSEALERSIEAFATRALDGLVEISRTTRGQPTADADGPTYIRKAAIQTVESIDRLGRATISGGFETRLSLRASTDTDCWKLRIGIPVTWSDQMTTSWTSQFLVIFLRRRIENLQRVEAVSYENEGNLLPIPRNRQRQSAWAAEEMYD